MVNSSRLGDEFPFWPRTEKGGRKLSAPVLAVPREVPVISINGIQLRSKSFSYRSTL